jgi:hypothetical protein
MSGMYDDYGLDCVFSTREKAEAYVKQKDGYYEIKETELDAELPAR